MLKWAKMPLPLSGFDAGSHELLLRRVGWVKDVDKAVRSRQRTRHASVPGADDAKQSSDEAPDCRPCDASAGAAGTKIDRRRVAQPLLREKVHFKGLVTSARRKKEAFRYYGRYQNLTARRRPNRPPSRFMVARRCGGPDRHTTGRSDNASSPETVLRRREALYWGSRDGRDALCNGRVCAVGGKRARGKPEN